MHQGNWTCSTCSGAITELPFVPKSDKGLTCRACFMKSKGGNVAAPQSAPAPELSDIPFDAEVASEPNFDDGFGPAVSTPASGDKPRFSGDWQCAGCGASITSLPFTPRDTSNLKCIDCFKNSKR